MKILPDYVRHFIGHLPMTGKVIGTDVFLSGRQAYKVNVFGYSLSKVEYWPVDECKDYVPSAFMAEQLAGWLRLAGSKN